MTSFLVVAVVLIVTPGPDFALTVRNTVTGGTRAGVVTAFGVVTGQLVWGAAAAAGITALLAASHPAFLALRVAGAAYLAWLGLSALHRAARGLPHAAVRARGGGPWACGLASNLGNPKMALFFTGLLPQFGTSPAALLAHAALFAALTLGWLAAVARAGGALRVPAVRRALDAVSGIVLVAFGIRFATSAR